ncbi:uncharacterized protein LOC126558965 [Anopheles maculipalpis]|uniref:uncharacterized protein LOC126558965 n=1 Tax=Anopheles maculipalpis TaxID=1496333 RepID=UPI002158FE0B|nr:uncharacterized protein LOC126558965 [Anopheles maculipalpis]
MSSKKSAKTVTIQLRPVYRGRTSYEEEQAAGPSGQRISPTGPPVKSIASKSRYKIYEIPRKSEFSEYLERIRREQEARQAQNATHRTLAVQTHDQDAGPSQRLEAQQNLLSFDKPITVLRQGSIVEYREKERHPFKELVSNYLRRSSHPKEAIRLYKIPIVQSWEQAIENSLRKMAAERSSRGEQWKQSRLKWLEDLEEANSKLPQPNRTVSMEKGFDPSICCFLMWCRRN